MAAAAGGKSSGGGRGHYETTAPTATKNAHKRKRPAGKPKAACCKKKSNGTFAPAPPRFATAPTVQAIPVEAPEPVQKSAIHIELTGAGYDTQAPFAFSSTGRAAGLAASGKGGLKVGAHQHTANLWAPG